MNRLSDRYKILFIEEPDDPDEDHPEGTVTLGSVNQNLAILTPHLPWNNWKAMCWRYVPILKQHVPHLTRSCFWFYAPFYVHILDSITPSRIVYDCMDELAAFKNASPNLPAYEKQLMSKSNVVFTGGRSLYEARKELHPNIHCFPSAVDHAHFKRALQEETIVPEDLLALPQPVAGYFGVIDERIDFVLLQAVAEKLPGITIALIGPFAKIEKTDVVQVRNIHYLGKKAYAHLPHYLKGFDVAIMPFAINEATRFLSPTKTLEYLAGGKPVVSTPVPDIVSDYADVVRVATHADEFARHIQECLEETMQEKQARQLAQQVRAEKTSWEQTVRQMESILAQTSDSVGSTVVIQ